MYSTHCPNLFFHFCIFRLNSDLCIMSKMFGKKLIKIILNTIFKNN